jgi:hypothetical protein
MQIYTKTIRSKTIGLLNKVKINTIIILFLAEVKRLAYICSIKVKLKNITNMKASIYSQEYYNGLLIDLEIANALSPDEVCRKFNTDSVEEIRGILMDEIELTEKYLNI